ncbi:MAG TPA: hypothetical protein VFW28_06415 [Micropepsaceae bacterium]|nr:hypothetical protein [Micropepsaceae bacterium]
MDIEKDTKLFLNARAIGMLNSEFGDHCKDLLQDFFSELLSAVRSGRAQRAFELLSHLREPNETHLGLSVAKSEGRGLGPAKAREIWQAFCASRAVKTGLLSDLEDTVLLIDGISVDILSDIITNIIRGPLIGYTQNICRKYSIPLAEEVSSGPVWNMNTKSWDIDYVSLPTPNYGKLLLVPKSIVRIDGDYNVGEYYRHYILERLKEEEVQKNSSLVHVIKHGQNKGKKKVYKTELMAKYGKQEKAVSIEQTQNFPDLLRKYKADHAAPTPALSHRQIADAIGSKGPDWDALLKNVTALEPGKKNAYDYEEAILDLTNALFYPVLVDPDTQTSIHNGLKRVDITFTNYARSGFFEWVGRNYNSPYIFVECKNFGDEIGNPEIDQIAMRLSKARGMFGMVMCRKVEDRKRLLQRCQAVASDEGKFIIVLEDDDLKGLVEEARVVFPQNYEFPLLRKYFKELVF